MYSVHSDNVDAFEFLLKFDVELLWRNEKPRSPAIIIQLLAKNGLMELAENYWNILHGGPKGHHSKAYQGQYTGPVELK